MSNNHNSTRKSGKVRTSVRQRISYRMVLMVGIPVMVITILLIIVFQLFKNETIKAEKRAVLTTDQLPVELVVEDMITINADTNMREGVRYKVAKVLPQTPQQ